MKPHLYRRRGAWYCGRPTKDAPDDPFSEPARYTSRRIDPLESCVGYTAYAAWQYWAYHAKEAA